MVDFPNGERTANSCSLMVIQQAIWEPRLNHRDAQANSQVQDV